ncbi:uncharacterized protein TNCV_4789671 [Trichonephila clavipes]|nr:uncharacterized protein TNCV_4789671 [Trichonephila clavipes]
MEKKAVHKFYAKLDKSTSETYQLMKQEFTVTCLNRSYVFVWNKRFLEEKDAVEDDQRSGRPISSRTPEIIEKCGAGAISPLGNRLGGAFHRYGHGLECHRYNTSALQGVDSPDHYSRLMSHKMNTLEHIRCRLDFLPPPRLENEMELTVAREKRTISQDINVIHTPFDSVPNTPLCSSSVLRVSFQKTHLL